MNKDITLKKLTAQDIELVRGWRNDSNIASYMYSEEYISKENQVEWFNNIDWSTSYYWIIEYDNKKVGLASITGINKTLQSCYWAFYLGDSSIRGAGIGSKVEYNVLKYVFSYIKLNKLRCEVLVSNYQVIKMHEKFGFRREAYYREHCIKGNSKLDVVGLAILKSEWDGHEIIMKEKIYGK